ncbi:cyclic pyranopterin monophosphate synthase MoaC [Candidatus Aerophobetes bacterium]|nr:cyclic pyranopterin monophosphate synthase MoaC [Candidatus Aerophobetes bacterium]
MIEKIKMVDVGDKKITKREAIARGYLSLKKETVKAIKEGKMPKGDVLSVANVAGILAAKKTSSLIPMCHPLRITNVKIDFELKEDTIIINSKVSAIDRTGVEMEALTAVALAALTIYDMCKGVDREISISNIELVEKKGGKSGHFIKKQKQKKQD